ncbi:hypothetical protein JAB5_10860 [Janthinobacterium sp. HH103]|nr:hypothetical protein JAB5_10860 [Janthinobacterium sp. HH103]
MRHIRQEFGFVAAGPLQLFRARFQLGVRLADRHVLLVQRQRLHGQLLVRLLQRRLLLFQVGLRLFQHARLLAQLFISRAQLFLLHFQFFIQLLRFFKDILQALAVQGRFQRRADIGANQVQPFLGAGADGMCKAQLDDAVDEAFIVDGHQHQFQRRAAAQARRHGQIILGHLLHVLEALFARGLADQAFAQLEHLFFLHALFVETVHGRAAQTAILVDHVQGGHGHFQPVRQEVQHVPSQLRQAQLAARVGGQLRLSRAQPCLLLQHLVVLAALLERIVIDIGQAQQFATSQVGEQAGQSQAEDQEHHHGQHGAALGRVGPLLAQALFHGQEGEEFAADFVEFQLAFALAHAREEFLVVAALGDHGFRILHPLPLQRADAAQPVHLDGVVRHELEQGAHFHGDLCLARFIRRQERFITRQQVAAHACFQVDGQLHDFVGVADHPFGMLDRAQGREQVGDQADKDEGRDDPDKQRQGNVAGEDAAKAEGVDRGLGIHHVRVRLSRKSQF